MAALAEGLKAQHPLFTDMAGDILGPHLLLIVEASFTQRKGHML